MKKFLLFGAGLALSMSAFADDVVLFQDNFEWLATETNISTYTNSKNQSVSDNVGDKMYSGAYNPQSTTIKSNDGTKSVWDLLKEKGYDMESDTEANAKKAIGCARNYIKMAITDITAALTLPAMPAAGNGISNVHLSFDWTPMTDGGKAEWDPTAICVEVLNGESSKVYPIEKIAKVNGWIDGDKEKGAITPYQWHNVDIVLDAADCVINKDTRISLRNVDDDFPETDGKKRWFLDNIKVYTTTASVDEIATDNNAPVEYFNLQGVKVANPANGMFIRRQGNKVAKVVM